MRHCWLTPACVRNGETQGGGTYNALSNIVGNALPLIILLSIVNNIVNNNSSERVVIRGDEAETNLSKYSNEVLLE